MPNEGNYDRVSIRSITLAASCPRLSRASTSRLRRLCKDDVDARDKAGHDSKWSDLTGIRSSGPQACGGQSDQGPRESRRQARCHAVPSESCCQQRCGLCLRSCRPYLRLYGMAPAKPFLPLLVLPFACSAAFLTLSGSPKSKATRLDQSPDWLVFLPASRQPIPSCTPSTLVGALSSILGTPRMNDRFIHRAPACPRGKDQR